MCGIAGILSLNPALVQQNKLLSMANALQHRGPDGEGFWINDSHNIGFAHRRLSIIDLSNAAAQPMHYLNRYTITYNGEIYNYLELKEGLKKKGYQFQTQSDTEVILAAYDCYKEKCVEHFDGMFAFALWDEQEQKLFAARDRFGEKPFYFHQSDDAFYFVSEMKALWAIGISKDINNTGLLNYITIGEIGDLGNPHFTFYQNIFKLPASHYLQIKFTDGYLDIFSKQYWHLDKEGVINLSQQEAQQKFQSLFYDSVNKRLRSDVAVGTSLSGGLDSSSIVATINKLQTPNSKQVSFSAIFPGFEKDESKYIAQVTQQFSLQNHTVTPTAEGFINDFEKLMYHQEEPIQSASIYAQYKVYELAKQHGVTVLLDGQGADETLSGYTKYYHWYWQELLRTKHFGLLKKERQATTNHVDWSYKNYLAAFAPSLAAKQLENNLYKQVKNNSSINANFFLQHFSTTIFYKPVVEKLNDVLYYNSMQNGLEELLRYADRNSMAHSREVRLPFLNHELVQFIFSLQSSFKIKDGFTKWILRKTMEQQLPSSIVWRADKIGFEPPQHLWMQQAKVKDMMHESKKKLVSQGILNQSSLETSVIAKTAHAADNFDWRYLSAACML